MAMDTTCPSCYLLSIPCECFEPLKPISGTPTTREEQSPVNPAEPLLSTPKEKRKRFSAADREFLWSGFHENPYPSSESRKALARQLNVTPRCVQMWFQNARAEFKVNCPSCKRSRAMRGTDVNAQP